MRQSSEAEDLQGLERQIKGLADHLRGLRRNGGPKVHEVQQIASELTQLQLLLNELERVEVRGNRPSREAAERFAAVESRIRGIRGELYDELRRDRSA